MTDPTDPAENGKADFSHLYRQPDPRGYYRALGALDYQIPQQGQPLFAAVRRAQLKATPSASGPLLDVCCSYGVNASLLRTDLTLSDLYRRYADPALADVEPDQLAAADRRYYAEHGRQDAPEVLGLDVAAEAVAYGRQVGLLADGWAENLEESEPSESLVRGIQEVRLMVITGGVGYITERTFARLMRAFPPGRRPWIAAFVLRVFPYDAIAETLADYGLTTERLDGATFKQRRFESQEEQEAALQQLHSLGRDTRGLEDGGYYHTEFFLSRPASAIDEQPLDELVAAHRAA